MEFVVNNIGWILLAVAVLYVVFYRKILGIPAPFTSQIKVSLTIKANRANAIDYILQALKSSGFIRAGFDSGEDRFFAQSKISLSSWTEHIDIRIKENNPDEQTLEFISTCALPTQVIGWGKNKRNARRFIKAIEPLVEVSL